MTKDNKLPEGDTTDWREEFDSIFKEGGHLGVLVITPGDGVWGVENRYATPYDIKAFIEQAISKELEKQREEILRRLPNRDNEVFGIPVVVSDKPDPSDDYKKGFTGGFNEAIRQSVDSIKTK